MIPEDTMSTAKRGRPPTSLPSYNAYEPHQKSEWHDNFTGNGVAHILPVSNGSLNRVKTHSIRVIP